MRSSWPQRGYTAPTFNFAGWGDSGGERPHVDSPDSKIADIGAAAAYGATTGPECSSELDYDADPHAAPCRRGRTSWPRWSWRERVTFDRLAAADRVSTPVLFVHSHGCVFPDMVRDLVRRVGGAVEVAWGDGTQAAVYDLEQVRLAIDAVDRHLIATMPVEEEVRG